MYFLSHNITSDNIIIRFHTFRRSDLYFNFLEVQKLGILNIIKKDLFFFKVQN